jgi:cysteine desulfurase / selenocysteine lyase
MIHKNTEKYWKKLWTEVNLIINYNPMNFKKDFPIFDNNPWLIYLDSTATSQKPSFVIEGIKEYLENDYANIHRGSYSLSERSEEMYKKSKEITAKFIWSTDYREIICTYNANYALNLLSASLKRSQLLKRGDKVLISVVEHHSNIVPWLILKEEIGIEIDYVNIDEDFWIDFDDFEKKFTADVKLVSFTAVSNVTGEIFDVEKLGNFIKKKNKDIIFVVDASQSVPHIPLDVKKIQCDFAFFTGHKLMADTGIGILWGKKEILDTMKPAFSGWGAISKVLKDCFFDAPLPDRFEAGTPNLSWAVSLLRAFEYIEKIGGYETLVAHEQELIEYTLKKFESVPWVRLIWWKNKESKVGVFSFIIEGIHSIDISEYLATKNICIRAGQHCAEPFLDSLGLAHTCRVSFYIYNTVEDIDIFFQELHNAIIALQ